MCAKSEVDISQIDVVFAFKRTKTATSHVSLELAREFQTYLFFSDFDASETSMGSFFIYLLNSVLNVCIERLVV